MVADERVLVGHARALRHTQGGVDARIRKRNDAIHVGRRLVDQLQPHTLATLIHVLAENNGIGPGKVHQLKNALTHRRGIGQGVTPVVQGAPFRHDHFSGPHFAQTFGLQQVKGATFGSEHPGIVHAADGERVKAVGIA